MKVVKWTETVLLAVFLVFGFANFSNADESATETVKEAGRDLKKGTKKAWRNTKDEACEMVNGKMECAGQKIKNKTYNATDEVQDKVDAD